MKSIFLIIAFVSALVSCDAQQKEDSSRGYKVKVGEQSPNISLQLLEGGEVTSENLKGKVVVLQFTASWCSVCREEMPHLEKEVWQRFKGNDFMLIAVDLKEKPEKIRPFIATTGITYPVAMDSDGKLFEAFTLPKAGVTRNIVLDSNGKIIFLSRLYERVEFDKMIEVIEKELKM
ncbi:MAG: TlpA family protein disulfide reductase [Flavobacteriales bacterium]|nr:TlpA family protein disulfide reductase [Flavobacteriales bacterium]